MLVFFTPECYNAVRGFFRPVLNAFVFQPLDSKRFPGCIEVRA